MRISVIVKNEAGVIRRAPAESLTDANGRVHWYLDGRQLRRHARALNTDVEELQAEHGRLAPANYGDFEFIPAAAERVA